MIEPKISFAFEKRARVASHLNFLKIEFSEYKENLKNLMSGSNSEECEQSSQMIYMTSHVHLH